MSEKMSGDVFCGYCSISSPFMDIISKIQELILCEKMGERKVSSKQFNLIPEHVSHESLNVDKASRSIIPQAKSLLQRG